MTVRAVVFGVILFIAWPSIALGQPVDIKTGQSTRRRSPAPWSLPAPPTANEQAKAESTIKQLLAGRIDLTGDDTTAVCRDLRELARGTDDDPMARYVLLRMAYNLALQSVQWPLANELIDDMALSYAVDAIAMRTDVLTAECEHLTGDAAPPRSQLAQAFQILESALMADRIDVAAGLVSLAHSIADRTDDRIGQEQVARWSSTFHQWSAQTGHAQHAALSLLQQPEDAGAQLALGRYLCFIKGDWAHGLPRLARGNVESLRTLAQAELSTGADDPARMAVAQQWRQLAATHDGLARRRLLLHAEEIDRRLYPAVTGLTRMKLEEQMLSRPLLVFDSADPPSADWIEEHLHFRGGHGREGRGSWANISLEHGEAVLVANRAGFIETRDQFPSPDVDHYEIEAQLQSDVGNGAALEFGGQRMYVDRSDGLHMEGGWVPNVIYPIQGDRSDHYLIDVAPDAITFTLNGVVLGTMPMDHLARGGMVLRGWEGHVRCRRLVVWALPDDDLAAPLPTVSQSTTPGTPANDPGFEKDLRTMRQTVSLAGTTLASKASTGEAIAAAVRVFERFPEVGMTRSHVLKVLGDPKTISGYGIAAEDESDAPLVYRFDTGFGGVYYTVQFRDGCVVRVEKQLGE